MERFIATIHFLLPRLIDNLKSSMERFIEEVLEMKKCINRI